MCAGVPSECLLRERRYLSRYVRMLTSISLLSFSEPDSLKDAWSPVLTLKTALVSLQSLLCSPEPSDPQGAPYSPSCFLAAVTIRTNAEVARHYINDRKGSWSSLQLRQLRDMNHAQASRRRRSTGQRRTPREATAKHRHRRKSTLRLHRRRIRPIATRYWPG